MTKRAERKMCTSLQVYRRDNRRLKDIREARYPEEKPPMRDFVRELIDQNMRAEPVSLDELAAELEERQNE